MENCIYFCISAIGAFPSTIATFGYQVATPQSASSLSKRLLVVSSKSSYRYSRLISRLLFWLLGFYITLPHTTLWGKQLLTIHAMYVWYSCTWYLYASLLDCCSVMSVNIFTIDERSENYSTIQACFSVCSLSCLSNFTEKSVLRSHSLKHLQWFYYIHYIHIMLDMHIVDNPQTPNVYRTANR